MPASDPSDDLPRASVARTKRARISVVWIIPALAALVALGIAIQRLSTEGPTISIVFAAAAGIEPGKTPLKYKDVMIGQVTAVELVDNYSHVRVTARLTKSAAGLMVEDTKFWVVEPHIGLTGISGLSTLLSGNYIGVQAGKSTRERRKFEGLAVQPRITDQPGRRFVLRAPDLGSIGIGAPIYYHLVPVGEVESFKLAGDGKSVEIGAFVAVPFDLHVQRETRFWNVSGLDVALGENGVEVRTASLLALIAGGLSFDTPEFSAAAAPAPEGTVFQVYGDRAVAMKQPDAYARRYVLMFGESVRGLAVGAPVTLMGLTVGEVTDIGLSFEPKSLAVHARVLITFFPERAAAQFTPAQREAVRSNTEQDVQKHLRMLRRLVDERGLRAQLRTSSLLTGQKYVAFDFLPEVTQARVDWRKDPLELPVAPGAIADLEAKVGSILTKINAMPITVIGQRVAKVLQTLDQTLKDADVVLKHVDVDAVPEVKRALEDLHKVLDNANATLIGRDAPGQQSLREALQEIGRAARAFRELSEYLERHPEALIRGKSQEQQ